MLNLDLVCKVGSHPELFIMGHHNNLPPVHFLHVLKRYGRKLVTVIIVSLSLPLPSYLVSFLDWSGIMLEWKKKCFPMISHEVLIYPPVLSVRKISLCI